MSLLPSLIVLLAVLLLTAASGQQLHDAGLLASQQADRVLAWRKAEAALAHSAAALLAGAAGVPEDESDDGDDSGGGGEDGSDGATTRVETLLSAADSELGELPLNLQRVTATGEAGRIRVHLQADYAVDGCESAHDDACTPRLRRIAWRQLSPD